MMNCKTIAFWLTDYVNGTLLPAERTQAQTHLDQCPACAQQAQGMMEMRQALRALPHRQTSPMFEARLAERLAQAQHPVRRGAWWSRLAPPTPLLLRPALALGAVTLAVAGAAFLHPWGPAATVATPTDDYNNLISQSVALHQRDVAAQPLAAPATGIAASHSAWTVDSNQGAL